MACRCAARLTALNWTWAVVQFAVGHQIERSFVIHRPVFPAKLNANRVTRNVGLGGAPTQAARLITSPTAVAFNAGTRLASVRSGNTSVAGARDRWLRMPQRRCDRLVEPLQRHRLDEVKIESRRECTLPVFRLAVAGQRNQRCVAVAAAAKSPGNLVTVDVGQPDVDDGHV